LAPRLLLSRNGVGNRGRMVASFFRYDSRPLLSALVGGLVAMACGGKVVVDEQASSRVGAGGGASTSVVSGAGASNASTSSSGGGLGGAAGCPAEFPGKGTPCAVPADVQCAVAFSCCGLFATCQGGIWTVSTPDCHQACVPCGPDPDFACSVNALCVVHQGLETTYTCSANPCGSEPVSCACASSVCEGGTRNCDSAQGSTVTCACPSCGTTPN
jgi:hypothetical protein